jgi:hypothetical protein
LLLLLLLLTEELYEWNWSLKVVILKWRRHLGCGVEYEVFYWFVVVTLKGKRILWRPRRRWKVNSKIARREVGRDGWKWMKLAGQEILSCDRLWLYRC